MVGGGVMSAFVANDYLTFLTADTRELVLSKDFEERMGGEWFEQNVFYLRSGKPAVRIKMRADAKEDESLWYWFLSENYPQFLKDKSISNEQLRQIAYWILDGIYIEETATARKFLIDDELQNIFPNFRYIGKIYSGASLDCLVQSGGYVKKMVRDFYPIVKPVKLSFDLTVDYDDLYRESEIVYLSCCDDRTEEV